MNGMVCTDESKSRMYGVNGTLRRVCLVVGARMSRAIDGDHIEDILLS